jgi:importin subunit beta-1
MIWQDPNRSEALLRTSMGVIGDLSETFPNGEYAQLFSQQWITAMAREVRSNKEYTQRTQDTARWAREQIKRQSGRST